MGTRQSSGYEAVNVGTRHSIWVLGSQYGYLAVNVDTGQSMLKMAQQRLEAQPAKLLPAKGHQVVAPWVAAESKGVCTRSYQLKCSGEPAEVQLEQLKGKWGPAEVQLIIGRDPAEAG